MMIRGKLTGRILDRVFLGVALVLCCAFAGCGSSPPVGKPGDVEDTGHLPDGTGTDALSDLPGEGTPPRDVTPDQADDGELPEIVDVLDLLDLEDTLDPYCGDGLCDPNEDTCQCPEDCGAPCDGRQCGVSVCGESCGDCTPGQSCTEAGKCVWSGPEFCWEIVDCMEGCQDESCADDCLVGAAPDAVTVWQRLKHCIDTYCPEGSADDCFEIAAVSECQEEWDECFDGCQPDCEGVECGWDGCAGSCGGCPEHHECADGQCAYKPWCGDGSCDVESEENCGNCPLDCSCAACGEECVDGLCTFTACLGAECGEDGCGGNCGTCPDCGEDCRHGQCAFVACESLECGEDGCGGECGTCPVHFECAEGLCMYIPWCGDGTCDPGENCLSCPDDCACPCGHVCGPGVCLYTACERRECGDDGCGGNCGICPAHYACEWVLPARGAMEREMGRNSESDPEGRAVCVYVPWCGDANCDPGEHCGVCPGDCPCGCGENCVAGECRFTACEGLECGSDGCGGICGVCPENHACMEGLCHYVPWCGDATCQANEGCQLCPEDCPCLEGEVCYGNACCAPRCEGKVCGDDGCGGNCGTCDECGHTCVEDQCVFTACEGLDCGPDGCDGVCGDCVLPDECINNYCLNLRWTAVGSGMGHMGCSLGDEACSPAEHPAHVVYVSGFEFMAFEVTVDQFRKATGRMPEALLDLPGQESYPVTCVSWTEAREFCVLVGGRLPSETEWEFAARLSGTDPFACQHPPECLESIAWFGDHAEGTIQPVGTRDSSGSGLYDLTGNVREWVEDCWHDSYNGAPVTGQPPWVSDCENARRLTRGGDASLNDTGGLRVSDRLPLVPELYYSNVGIRCARPLAEPGTCGDGACSLEDGEDCVTCQSDCGPCCGDGMCDASLGEGHCSCPDDCGTCQGCCWGSVCLAGDDELACGLAGEACTQCKHASMSCVDHVCAYVCGDSHCGGPDESRCVCPQDCGEPCENRVCGDDGCGGTCGACLEHHECQDGQCIYIPWCGDGHCDAHENCASCPQDCACDCGYDCRETACVYVACNERQCGDDGCGRSCGGCPEHFRCAAGQCEYVPWCGDGTCDLDEDCFVCPQDCGECCGDGSCDAVFGETCANCVEDCACTQCGTQCLASTCVFTACQGKVCGDNGCNGSCGSCSAHYDCQAGLCVYVPWCGDGTCDNHENCDTCPSDCGSCCGNGLCESHFGETQCTCAGDCGSCPGCCQNTLCRSGTLDNRCGKHGAACQDCSAKQEHCIDQFCVYIPWCGDGHCDPDETCFTCSQDCGACCGDGICNAQYGESQCSCSLDCGLCLGCCLGTACVSGFSGTACGFGGAACRDCNEEFQSCVDQECVLVCGDGFCGEGEEPCSCPQDCGVCVSPGFAAVLAGGFWMGSPEGCPAPTGYPGTCAVEPGRSATEKLHYVSLTRNFEMQKSEVTQGQWKQMFDGWNPSQFQACGDSCPVENISWFDAVHFANSLSVAAGIAPCLTLSNVQCHDTSMANQAPAACMNGTKGGIRSATVTVNAPSGDPYQCAGYRLPTEAEWERATRAGTTTAFYSGPITYTGGTPLDPNLGVIGWYMGNNVPVGTKPVKGKAPNTLGFHDLSGNVREWCFDFYSSPYPSSTLATPALNPAGPTSGTSRVLRGGAWLTEAQYCRSADRFNELPSSRNHTIGFRLAKTL